MFRLPVMLVLTMSLIMVVVAKLGVGYDLAIKNNKAISAVIFLAGLLVIGIGGYQFRKANTTFDPSKPENTSSLVTHGVYKLSRNPMYVGFFMWLLSVAIFLDDAINAIALIVFILLANRLYIIPEEKALDTLFGAKYTEYKSRVRRWI